MVMEDDLTLDGSNTIQYKDDTSISYNVHLESVRLPSTCNKNKNLKIITKKEKRKQKVNIQDNPVKDHEGNLHRQPQYLL